MNASTLNSEVLQQLYARAQQEGRPVDDLLNHLLNTHQPTPSTSTSLHAFLFEHITDAVLISGENGQILECNRVAVKRLGYTRHELRHMNTAQIVHPDYRLRMQYNHEKLWSGETVIVETMHVTKDGKAIPVEINAQCIDYEGKKALLAVARDITDRKQAEEALRASEEKFRTVADWNYDWEYWTDPTGTVIYMSPAVERITGYPLVKFQANPDLICEIVHPDDQAIWESHRENAHSPEITETEFRIIRRDGSIAWVQHICRAITNESGTYLGLRVSNRDITDRKQAEEALRASEEKFRLIAENTWDGILVYNIYTGHMQYVSPSYDRMMGREPGQTERMSLAELTALIHPEDHEEVVRTVNHALANKSPSLVISYRTLHPHGHYIWREDHARFNYAPDGTYINTYVISRDISDRKRAQEALRAGEEKFRLIAENTSDGIMIVDGTTEHVTYTSPGYERMMGHDPADRPARDRKKIFETIHPEDRERVFAEIYAAMQRKQENLTYTFRARHRDGHYIWREDRARFQYNEQGALLVTYVIARDISDRKAAEEALRENEERFRQVVENISEVFWLRDANTQEMLYISPAYERMWGRPAQEMYESPAAFMNTIHPEDRDQFLASTERLEREGIPIEVQYRILKPDGSVRRIHARTYPVKNPQGQIYRYAGINEDITERQSMADALQESQRRARSLVESQTTYVIRTDLSGKYTYVNPAFERKFRWLAPEGTLLGTPSLNTIHPEAHERVFEAVVNCAQNPGQPTQVIVRKPTQTDSILWTLWEFVALTDSSGKLSEYQCVGIDITELMKARQQLQLQEEALQATANTIVITNPDGVIEWVNPAFTTLTGYSLEEVLNQRVNLLRSGIQDDDFYKTLWDTILAGESWNGRLVNRRKDGSLYTEEQTITPVKDDNGVIRHFIAVKQDVTELEQAEQLRLEQERLKASLKKEQEQNLLIQRIISALSHDLRTPLAVISSSREILVRYFDQLSQERRLEKLDAIGKQTQFAIELLQDTVLMARGNRHEMNFHPAPVNLSSLCQISVNEIQQTVGQHHQVRFSSDEHITTVLVDETLITRILLNLLSNAVKFSPEGSDIELKLSQRDDRIVLEIKDQGIGISQNDLTHIFEPFFRADSVRTINGTGLGLSIVKDCVECHHGTIHVTSEIGRGSVFTVELPLQTP